MKRTTKLLLGAGAVLALLPLVLSAGASAAVPAKASPHGAVLTRYNNGKDHWVTSGPVSRDYHREGSWRLAPDHAKGARQLYGCVYGTPHGPDHFLSLRSDCEGKTRLRTEGWVYTGSSPAHHVALYRCNWERSVDHFVSVMADCENPPGPIKNEGPLGYVAR